MKVKYRVWDKIDNKFITDGGIKLWENGHLEVVNYTGNYSQSEERFEYQISTGLKDKNGRDIYEGDIVKADLTHERVLLSQIDVNEGDLSKLTNGEIKWICEGWNVCQKYFGRVELSEFVCCNSHPCGLEVIGNIFENSNLIK